VASRAGNQTSPGECVTLVSFLQTLPQGQVAVPGAEFIVDWAGRVDYIKTRMLPIKLN